MAGKNQVRIEVRLPEDLLRQLTYMSEAEGRTVNNQILMLVRNSLAYFERTKGRIDQKKLASVDLSGITLLQPADDDGPETK